MKKNDSIFLEHMLNYIIKLEKFVKDLEYNNFLNDEVTQNNIIRLLEVMGEASVKLSKEIKDGYPEVARAKIKGMRNILVHDYGNIQLKIIWNTVITGIPPLKEQIKKIIKDVNPQILLNYE